MQKKGVVFLGGRGSYYGTSRKSNVISVDEWRKRRETWKNRDYMKQEERPKESPFMQQKKLKSLLESEKDANKRRALEQSLANYKKSFEKPKSSTNEKQYKTSPEIEGLRNQASRVHDEYIRLSNLAGYTSSWSNAKVKQAERVAEFSGQKFDAQEYAKQIKKQQKAREKEYSKVRKQYHDLIAQIKRLGGKTSDL